MGDSRSVTREIGAAAPAVFDLLARPSEHHRFDASAMVGEAAAPGRVAVGEVFTMHMTWTDGDTVEHYRTDNHVTVFEADRRVEWAVAPAGDPPLGWRWRYELEPLADGRCRVTLTYDWSGTDAANRERYGVPLFDETDLAASLELLAAAVE